MATILLVNTSFVLEKRDYLEVAAPLGLLSIASPLVHAGHNVILVDPQIDENYMRRIREHLLRENILYVGMTTFMGTNIKNAIEITDYIKKESPGTKVVWGGPLATSVPEICFESSKVDYIAMGMGEETALNIADCFRTGMDIAELPHVSYRGTNGWNVKELAQFDGDIDCLETPALKLWEEGVRKIGYIPVMSSRGCPRNCSFCYNNTFTGRRKWFPRSHDKVIEEVDSWSEYFDIKKIEFLDDNFLVDARRACRILSVLKERGYSVDRLIGHMNDFKPEVVDEIHGFITKICFSIESASPKIQRLLNKKIDLNKALELCRRLIAVGVERITTIFMVGLPTENDEDLAINIATAKALRGISSRIAMPVFVYNPQPKDDITPMFDYEIDFDIDALSSMDTEPNRSRKLLHRVRPWMNPEDVAFYLDFVMVWYYHFHYEVRASQEIDVADIYDRNPRIAALFMDVPAP